MLIKPEGYGIWLWSSSKYLHATCQFSFCVVVVERMKKLPLKSILVVDMNLIVMFLLFMSRLARNVVQLYQHALFAVHPSP